MSEIELKSTISGTIIEIRTAEGKSIEEGDVVFVVESMKMEMTVTADDGGRVLRVLVSEGDIVSEGQVLAILQE